MIPSKETRRAEGRPRPEGNCNEKAKVRTQSRSDLPANLIRVNEAARRERQIRFAALLHHFDVEALKQAHHRPSLRDGTGP